MAKRKWEPMSSHPPGLPKTEAVHVSKEGTVSMPVLHFPADSGTLSPSQYSAITSFSNNRGEPSVVAVESDLVFAKLQVMKATYLSDMNELYVILSTRSKQPMPSDQLQKLKHYKDVLHRMIPYLRVAKERLPKEFNRDKVDQFEKQITNIMETYKKRRQPKMATELDCGTPSPSQNSCLTRFSNNQGGICAGDNESDLVYAKLQVLKASYLSDMNELYGMLSNRSTQPMAFDQLQKLKHYKDVLHRMIPYLRVPKERLPKEFNRDKVDAFEKQIINIMETFKKRRKLKVSTEFQDCGAPSPSQNSCLTRFSNNRGGICAGDNERDLVYGKLQVLKATYLSDMNELYGMLSKRSTQPMPSDQLEKVKHYKDVLYRMIPFLRVPKERLPKEFNGNKVDAFEKQIINIVETFRKKRHS